MRTREGDSYDWVSQLALEWLGARADQRMPG